MLAQTRKALVVANETVEVAPLPDIKLWILASEEVQKIQAEAEKCGRTKRRRLLSVPRRKVKVVKRWAKPHDSVCGFCSKGGNGLLKCYGCNVAAHKRCAHEDGQNNMMCLPNKTNRWVCDDCYFEAHGGGE